MRDITVLPVGLPKLSSISSPGVAWRLKTSQDEAEGIKPAKPAIPWCFRVNFRVAE
jgi:hypothetical protein